MFYGSNKRQIFSICAGPRLVLLQPAPYPTYGFRKSSTTSPPPPGQWVCVKTTSIEETQEMSWAGSESLTATPDFKGTSYSSLASYLTPGLPTEEAIIYGDNKFIWPPFGRESEWDFLYKAKKHSIMVTDTLPGPRKCAN